MLSSQAAVVGGAVGSAVVVVGQSAVNDGLSAETGWSAGMIAGGVAVFVYLDRRAAKREESLTLQRRHDDDIARTRISELEAEIRVLHDRIIALLLEQKEQRKQDE